jgi:hypothetical protein
MWRILHLNQTRKNEIMGKQSRALNRAKAATPTLPPSQTLTPDQMEELMKKQRSQQRMMQFMRKRPVPTHWQPVMQYLATLDKVAKWRDSDPVLKTLNDDQIVHGLMNDNLTSFSVGQGENRMVMYSLKQQYQPHRAFIQPAKGPAQRYVEEAGKQRYMKRFQPLFAEGILVNGRINIEAYFGALAQIQVNDAEEARQLEAARALEAGVPVNLGTSGQSIAEAIAANPEGEDEYPEGEDGAFQIPDGQKLEVVSPSNVGKSTTEVLDHLIDHSGLVQVETKKSLIVEVDDNDNVVDMRLGEAGERPASWPDTLEPPQAFPAGGAEGLYSAGTSTGQEP